MRGSIVCVAIFCLSYVSGATTVEEGKTFFKNYTFDKGEMIGTYETSIWKDEVVFAICADDSVNDVNKKFKVYLESTTNEDKDTLQSCDLNLTCSGSYPRIIRVFNAGKSRAVLAEDDGDDKIKLFIVHFKGCQIKETSIEVGKGQKYNPILTTGFSRIFAKEKSFQILLWHTDLCTSSVCKLTYDYEGNLVKAASNLPAVFENYDEIAYANNTYVVAKREPNSSLFVIYFLKDGEDEKNLRSVALINSNWCIALSPDENKIGVCWLGDGKMSCKQVHTEGESRTINIEFPFNVQPSSYYSLDVLNLEKGLLQLLVRDENVIHITHYDEVGKPGKSVQVDPKCKFYHTLFPRLYKNTDGQYCVNSICLTGWPKKRSFTITKKCFLKTELF